MTRTRRPTACHALAAPPRPGRPPEAPPDNYPAGPPYPVLDRRPPGRGFRHVLTLHDLQTFLGMLPDAGAALEGLRAIVLAPGAGAYDGFYDFAGVIRLCAWPRGLWLDVPAAWHREHRDLLERLGVACSANADGTVLCRFTEAAVRTYQLMHVLLHELGHHRDRMTTAAQEGPGRGEPFAEEFARAYEHLLWERYLEEFGPE
jgi:hypothetical protein